MCPKKTDFAQNNDAGDLIIPIPPPPPFLKLKKKEIFKTNKPQILIANKQI